MEPIKTDSGLQVAGDEDSTSEYAAVAALEQLFTGLRVGLPSLEVRCCSCGSQLGEGEQVSVYAYRTVETPRWHLARCRCPDCAPDTIETPALGATEVRLSARLAVVSDTATQQHRLCLAEPTVSTLSVPHHGTVH
jgi:ribosomal protein S27E